MSLDLKPIKARHDQIRFKHADKRAYGEAGLLSSDDVPALVAEVERLTARLVEIEGVHIEGCWRNCGKFPCSCECHASKIRYGSTDSATSDSSSTGSES